jgi:hypothetical protein
MKIKKASKTSEISNTGKTKKSDKPCEMSKILCNVKNIESIKRDYDLLEEGLTPNVIMHKITEICELYLKIIQQILQPEEFHAVYECNEFNEKDKTELFELYKRIIILHRELLKAVLMADDKNSLSTIQFAHTEMQDVRPKMLEILTKMQQSWKTETKKDGHKGSTQYFG